jgi:hypothetical protein
MELSGALHANPIDERDEQLSTFAGFHYQLPCLAPMTVMPGRKFHPAAKMRYRTA